MRLRLALIMMMTSLIAACQPTSAPMTRELPTLVQFPTETAIVPTEAIIAQSVTIMPTETAVPASTVPDTATATQQATLIPATNTPTLRPIVPTDSPLGTDFPEITDSRYADITFTDALALVQQTPLVVFPAEHVRDVYNRGRFRGLRDDFLLSVGDCNSESGWYLETLLDDIPPDSGVDSSFYEDERIQSTMDYFSPTFSFKGQSVNSGLNAASVLDPFWASADVCPFGESPLTCDYQLTDSFASLIMFGANDINVLSTAAYELAMREIIETTLERDVIPILSTFTVRQIEGTNTYAIGVRFNAVLIQLADEYQIPLVNFWLATRDLADKGILEDNAHLTVAGFNIRNQLTVEVLAQLRTEIMTEARNS
ncbi:MAG: SGNH/GDSL hydrolase family protein [Phototrophicaceae bacterium]